MTELKSLYEPIEPFDTGRLKVSPIHELYYEQCGNPNGKPVVFLHGGPGGGITPDYRRYFDPQIYRDRVVRSARFREEHAAREYRRQHYLAIWWQTSSVCVNTCGSNVGRCSAAHGAARSRLLTLRLIRTRHRARVARHLSLSSAGDPMVLSARRERDFSPTCGKSI